MSAVLFRPQEIRLIKGSPQRRREFLDSVYMSWNWEYSKALRNYNRALTRRNKILSAIAARKAQLSELYFWDKTLVDNGEIIQSQRELFLRFINEFFKDFQKGRFAYLSCRYEKSKTSFESLKKNIDKDISRGTTSIGPHRDDFVVFL